MRVPLNESATVTLDGSGNGTASIGPLSAREVWYPGNVHVSANANPANESTCRVYVGPQALANYFRDESPLGSTGDSSGACSQDRVKCGDKIWAVWSGGDPNVIAVLTVTGFRDV